MEFKATIEGRDSPIILKGRTAWALYQLMTAGLRGISTVANPAPRLSAYVHSLREIGIIIDTVPEKHGGDFPGIHGRYVLRSKVSALSSGGVA